MVSCQLNLISGCGRKQANDTSLSFAFALQDLESVFASEDESHLEKQLKEDSSVAKKRLNVRQATREWGRLTQRFTDHVLNEAGLQQANRGNRAYAIAFWNKSESARAHFNLGICYETGDAAERNLEKVRTVCKSHPSVRGGSQC